MECCSLDCTLARAYRTSIERNHGNKTNFLSREKIPCTNFSDIRNHNNNLHTKITKICISFGQKWRSCSDANDSVNGKTFFVGNVFTLEEISICIIWSMLLFPLAFNQIFGSIFYSTNKRIPFQVYYSCVSERTVEGNSLEKTHGYEKHFAFPHGWVSVY